MDCRQEAGVAKVSPVCLMSSMQPLGVQGMKQLLRSPRDNFPALMQLRLHAHTHTYTHVLTTERQEEAGLVEVGPPVHVLLRRHGIGDELAVHWVGGV